MGCTLMPRSKSAFDRRAALMELPTITGTTENPALWPVLSPRPRASSRKRRPRSCRRATRSGSERITRSAASADGRRGRRHAHTVEETRRGVLEVLDQRVLARDVAPAARERLAERPHPDVHVRAVDSEVLAQSRPSAAEHPEGMGLVDHQEGLVPALDFNETRQIRAVPVHAVDALDDDQHPLVTGPLLAQDLIEGLPVVVRKGQPARPGEERALQHTVVDQGVVEDEILAPEEVSDGGHVRGPSADQHHAVLDAVHLRERRLELALHRAFAGDRAARGGGGSIAGRWPPWPAAPTSSCPQRSR